MNSLTDLQSDLFHFIAIETLEMQHMHASGDPIADRLEVAARYAWALYMELRDNYRISFSPDMLRNRVVSPEDPEFFRHIHALQDLVGIGNYLRTSSN